MGGTTCNESGKSVLVLGASGTIGRAVVRELVEQGFQTFAFVRPGGSVDENAFQGAEIRYGDVTDAASVCKDAFADTRFDAVISCLASRSGSPKDAEAVDFQANLNTLKVAEEAGVDHFILLSAICVQRPKLAFQRAKIAFEHALKASKLDHTIIRPTAFFKSLSGQVERVAKGGRFMVFGDGELTRCKPISDADLARFIVACIDDPDSRKTTKVIGGPGPAISPRDQAAMLSELLGHEVKVRRVPLGFFTAAERIFALSAGLSDWCAERCEYARIARYYATESMLVYDPKAEQYDADATPEFGIENLRDHYRKLLDERV